MNSPRFNFKRVLQGYIQRPLLVSDLPGRYYRGLLIGGGVIVSVAILAASLATTMLLVNQYIEERIHLFVDYRGEIVSNIALYQTRMQRTVESYEVLWPLHDMNQVPAKRYQELLSVNGGVIVTEKDVTVTPISVFSLLNKPGDIPELSSLFRLIREVSPFPLLPRHDDDHYLGGFIYSQDRRFLAIWPPLTDSEITDARVDGIPRYIEKVVSRVENTMKNTSRDVFREIDMTWVSRYKSPITGEFIYNYAMPIFLEGKRVATIAITIPSKIFSTIFQNSGHEPGFFLVSQSRRHLLGEDKSGVREQEWGRVILKSIPFIEKCAATEGLQRRGKTFFICQSIPGPDWVAVYVFDWDSIVSALSSELIIIAGITIILNVLLLVFIFLINKFVLSPLRVNVQKLHDSEQFNRMILTNVPVALTVYDPLAGNVVMQNEAAKILLASCANDSNFYRRLVENIPWQRAEINSNDNGESLRSYGIDFELAYENDDCCELSVMISEARYQFRDVLLLSMTDVGDQKKIVRLLQNAKESADQANKAKSMFLAIMSHEIRTPLHGALGNLQLLAFDQLLPRQIELVSTIRRSFDALMYLINDILDYSKIEANELKLHVEEFRLEEIVEFCAQIFAPIILKKNIQFLCLIDPRLTGVWRGDARRLSQVLMNLLNNASKFTESGTITLRASLGEIFQGRTLVKLSVTDTGIGIEEDRRESIFEPFTQADSSISNRFGGTGLGLALCYRIISLMGGRISVDSEKGEGSIFTVDVTLVKQSCISDLLFSANECAFNSITVICRSPVWKLTLTKQLKFWMPEVEIIEADFRAMLPAKNMRSILLFAMLDEPMNNDWNVVQSSYIDTIILSAKGPLSPERRDRSLYVTSLSASMLKLALLACGKYDTVFNDVSPTNLLDPILKRDVKILIAEDDPVNRNLLERQLATLGYDCIDSVSNGKEALECCVVNTYDVIITDLGMPIMGGRELVCALRMQDIKTAVIANTADASIAAFEDLSGFAAIVYKPIAIEHLKLVLEQVLKFTSKDLQLSCFSTLSEPAMIDMQKIFSAGWSSDETELYNAWSAADIKRLLGLLHRLKGALSILDEKQIVGQIDELKNSIEIQGVAASKEVFFEFIDEMTSLVKSFDISINRYL